MKVLHVVSTLSTGGTAKALLSLAEGLKDRYGISSVIATTHPLTESVSRDDIAFPLVENASSEQLGRLVTEGDFDLIHWWKNTGSGSFRRFVKRVGNSRPPLLLTLCQVPVDPRHSLSIAEMEHADKIVFICREAYNHWRVRGVPEEARQLVYFGTWSPRDEAWKMTASKRSGAGFRFGRGSVLSKCPKGFLSVFRNIGIENSTFHVAGSGSPADLERIKAEIEETGLSDRVILEGQFGQDEWIDFLRNLDVFLYQLPANAFSAIDATMQDAMLAEVPVIYYGPPAPKELIVHGESGFIAETEQDIAFYARKLFHDPELRSRIGRQGRKRILETFSFDETVKQYREIYSGLCLGKVRSANTGRIETSHKLRLFLDRAIYLPFWVTRKLRKV